MLSINNNVAALTSKANLQDASNNLSSSIKKLSTGLRINQASDDASGLAISEKMRTQIRGLKKANENAQNGISMLQTAEGALNESHSILQRMRELAVQSSNGTLTANDRVEVQKEVDALKDEIDGISKRTEFNTKKLLTGDSTGLASASSDKMQAVLRGQVSDGEYQLEVNATAGKGQVQSTSVFRMKDGAQGIKEADLKAENASIDVVMQAAGADTADFTFNIKGQEIKLEGLSIGADAAVDAVTLRDAINNDENLNKYLVAVDDGTDTVTISVREGGKAGNGFTLKVNENDEATNDNVDLADDTAVAFTGGSDATTGMSELTNTTGLKESPIESAKYRILIDAGANALNNGTATDTYAIVGQYTQTNSTGITGLGDLAATVADAFTTTSNSSTGGYALVEFTSDAAVGAAGLDAKVSFDNGENWFSANDVWGAADTTVTDGTYSLTFNNAFTNNGVAANYQAGDKMLIALNDNDNVGAATSDLTTVNSFDPETGTAQTSAIFRHTDGALDDNTTTLKTAYMDVETGQVGFGSVDATFSQEKTGKALTDGTAEFTVQNGGGDVFGNTKLSDIDRFYDADGNFALGTNGETIAIYNAQGDKAEIYLDGGDTLNDVVDKFKTAILGSKAEGGLGMATGIDDVDKNIVSFVDTATMGSVESQQGTMVIRSTKAGEGGRLFVSAGEDIMRALGLSQSQTATENSLNVKVTNGLTGETVGEDTVTDNTLRNVIKGVDVEFDQSMDISATFNASSRSFDFASKSGSVTETLKIVDNSVDYQIGANQGQTLNVNIGTIDSHSLKVDKVQVTDQSSAKDAITALDKAIDLVSSERAKIGAWVNRLEHTMKNLDVQEENQTAAESSIRDLNVAQETTKLSKNQILSQASTSMLAQANQQAQSLLSLLR